MWLLQSPRPSVWRGRCASRRARCSRVACDVPRDVRVRGSDLVCVCARAWLRGASSNGSMQAQLLLSWQHVMRAEVYSDQLLRAYACTCVHMRAMATRCRGHAHDGSVHPCSSVQSRRSRARTDVYTISAYTHTHYLSHAHARARTHTLSLSSSLPPPFLSVSLPPPFPHSFLLCSAACTRIPLVKEM